MTAVESEELLMNQKDRLLLNTGFIFFGFGFAMNGHVVMALICAGISMMIAIYSHSAGVLLAQMPAIIPAYGIELFGIQISSLSEVIPFIRILSLASLISAACWMESSEKVIGRTMKGMTGIMLLFYGLSFFLKETVYGTADTCLLITLIFLPFSLGYGIRECRYILVMRKTKQMTMAERRILQ